jgi:hypothetical protein
MYMRLKDLFVAEGLTAGLRSSGGNGAIPERCRSVHRVPAFRRYRYHFDRGGDWYVMVDVISSKAIPMLLTPR